MFVDFIYNGEARGPVADQLSNVRFDPGLLRPYFDDSGDRCVTINTGKKDTAGEWISENVRIQDLRNYNGMDHPVWNATTLRKEEWTRLDEVVLKAARQRLSAWTDLAAASPYGGFDGVATMLLEQETMSDPGSAQVDMELLAEGRNDNVRYQLEGLPLPITSSGFWLSKRRLAASRNKGLPLNVTLGEAAGRRVAELVERTLIGTVTGLTYGGNSTQVGGYGRTSSVYGYLNFPSRNTKTNMTVPTGSNADTTITEVLVCRDLLYADNMFGPYMLYHSTDWDAYMDHDYKVSGGNNPNTTLRNRLRQIGGIMDVRRLDFLPSSSNPFTFIFVQMNSETAQAVNGLDITTFQWESKGGWRIDFVTACIHVPRMQADFDGRCGILVATTS